MPHAFRRGPVVLLMALLGALALVGCAASSQAMRPTPTPLLVRLPTATPIATPSDPTGQALLKTARSAVASDARSVGVTYDPRSRQLTVIVVIDGIVPDTDARIAAAYARVKALTFREQSDLWSSGLPLSQAQVIIMGPTQDEYADIVDQWYGIAVLTAPVARRIPWPNATPASAWALYDQTFLRPSFTVADDIVTGPAATATPGR